MCWPSCGSLSVVRLHAWFTQNQAKHPRSDAAPMILPPLPIQVVALLVANNVAFCRSRLACPQVMGKVKLEVEYVPFKVAADAKAALARRLTRTVSRSKINADHKGVLTVNLIKATNLAVRAAALRCPAFTGHCSMLQRRLGPNLCLSAMTYWESVWLMAVNCTHLLPAALPTGACSQLLRLAVTLDRYASERGLVQAANVAGPWSCT